MLFNSHYFIFIFLPICLVGWYAINHFKLYKTATLFLIGMSLWFYGFFNPWYLLIIVCSMFANYCFSFLMEKFPVRKTPVFVIGLIANIGLLGYFKYYDFFVENINAVFKTSFEFKHILLPLGISFFTLQQISYLADRYGKNAPHYALLDYFSYVAFFPQLIAGPIVLHKDLVPQLQDKSKRKFDSECFKDGLVLFIIGLSKKVLIADLFALIVNNGFDNVAYLDTPSAWLAALCYTFELYFDFSGYSDMACGLGLLFNIKIPVNFNSPYKAYDVRDFWRRWHITLSSFLTTYIYIPLGGSKKGTFRTFINTMIVFTISGFWHGASWTFVIWGILHGLGVFISRMTSGNKKHKILGRGLTFVFLTFAWAIFRSENISTMVGFLKAMFNPLYNKYMLYLAYSLRDISFVKLLLENTLLLSSTVLYWAYFALLALFILFTGIIVMGKNSHEILGLQKERGYKSYFVLFMGILLALCLVSMTGVSTFLYFNF